MIWVGIWNEVYGALGVDWCYCYLSVYMAIVLVLGCSVGIDTVDSNDLILLFSSNLANSNLNSMKDIS